MSARENAPAPRPSPVTDPPSQELIAAIATAPGEGAIGIVRLSGAGVLQAVNLLFRHAQGRETAALAPRAVHLGEIVDPATDESVDQVLLTLYRAPGSYTGEEMAEIAGHGGSVPLRRILTLALSHGARLAEPGEFTLRAFLNGKLDLAQAEAVIDVVRARTERGLGIAVRQLEGRLSALVRGAREVILPLVAHIEATIDFPEDVPELPVEVIRGRIQGVLETVEALLAGAEAGRIYRDGVRVVIAGRPNVGKSSLLNALLREERAIVTPIPGTTRDVIEEAANIQGIPIRTVDTAGIREARDPVEAIGVQRALEQVAGADLLLAVLDASEPLTADDAQVLGMTRGRPAVLVANKSDLPPVLALSAVREAAPGVPLVSLCARDGSGLRELEERIAVVVLGGEAGHGSDLLVSNARHAAALRSARDGLCRACETLDAGFPLELATTDLRDALDALGRITGESVPEEILAEIFGRFCIGK